MKLKYQIGYKGWVSMVFVATSAKILNPSFIVLSTYGERATWLLSLCAGITALLVVKLVLVGMRQMPGGGAIEVIEKRIGVWAGSIVSLLVIVFMLMDTAISVRFIMTQVKVVTLPFTPTSVLIASSLLLSMFLAFQGIRRLSRVSAVVVIWFILSVFLLAVLLFRQADIANIFPLFGPGLSTVLIQGANHSMYYGELLMFTLLRGNVSSQPVFEKGIMRGGLYSVLCCTFVILLVQLCLGSPTSSQVSFPFIELARLIYINRFIHHLEGYFAALWLLLALPQIAIYLYLTTIAYAKLFRFQHYRPLLIPMTVLAYIASFYPLFFFDIIVWKDMYLIQLGGWLIYGVILVLLPLFILKKPKLG